MNSEVWTEHLHDAYQQVDPTTVGGATIFRWSSVGYMHIHTLFISFHVHVDPGPAVPGT